MKNAWALIVAALVAGNVSAKTNLTVEHLNKLNKLYDVVVSPTRRYLVYGQKNVGFAPADTSADLYLMDLQDGNKVRRLTSADGKEHDVKFASDGKAIYFLADRSGSSQVYKLALDGGEAQQITDLPLDVQGYLIS